MQDINSQRFLRVKTSKDTHNQAQIKRVFEAFRVQPKTMLMVSLETGIFRSNICRYISKYQKQNTIHKIKTGLCQISKYRAGYYTTDENLFSKPLTLF